MGGYETSQAKICSISRFLLLELILCSFIIHDVFVLFLSADRYWVRKEQEISLEIKPTTHTGLLLSSWSPNGDYIVLEMSSGNVSSKLLCLSSWTGSVKPSKANRINNRIN